MRHLEQLPPAAAIIIAILVVLGSTLALLGSLGLVRLKSFYQRFFSQQFKRNCLPDGPKVGSVSFSPRGDWRMPSDAHATQWLKSLEKMESIV